MMLRVSSLARFRSSLLPIISVRSLSVVESTFNGIASTGAAQNAILAKYFDGAPVVSGDPQKWKDSVQSAISNNNSSQLRLLMSQSNNASHDLELVTNLLNYCLVNGNYSLAAELIEYFDESGVVLPEAVCQTMMSEMLEQIDFPWHYSLLRHMVRHNHNMTRIQFSRAIKSMLHSSVINITKAVQICQLMVELRRNQLNDFDAEFKDIMKGPHFHNDSLSSSLKSAFNATLTAFSKDGWYCSFLNQLLADVACKSGCHDLLVDHTRNMLDLLKQSSTSAVDTMSCLRQAISAELNTPAPTTLSDTQCSLQLLALLVDSLPDLQLKSPHSSADSPLRALKFYQMYFALSGRCVLTTLDADECTKVVPAEVLDCVHDRSMELYNLLHEFYVDGTRDSKIFKIQPGFDRRLFRQMCRAFSFGHNFVTSTRDDSQLGVKVYKFQSNSGVGSTAGPTAAAGGNIVLTSQPLSYLDVVLTNRKQIDGEPLYWRQVVAQHLNTLSDDVLMSLSHRVMSSLFLGKHSIVSWGLLWWEQLRRRDIPTPPLFVNSLLKMCQWKSDVVGAMEVLQVAKLERRKQQQDQKYFQKYKSSYERLFNDRNEFWNNGSGAVGASAGSVGTGWSVKRYFRKDVVELLMPEDWNLVFKLLNQSKSLGGKEMYNDAYTELVALMKDFDAEMDAQSLQNFLNFLTRTCEFNEEMLHRLVRRLMSDEHYPMSHKECAALSHYLLWDVRPAHRKVRPVDWPYIDDRVGYLQVFPDRLAELLTQASDRLTQMEGDVPAFHRLWSGLQTSAQSRKSMLDFLSEILRSEHPTLTNNHYGSFQIFSQVAILTAGMTCLHDGDHRAAYQALAEWSLAKTQMMGPARPGKERQIQQMQHIQKQ